MLSALLTAAFSTLVFILTTETVERLKFAEDDKKKDMKVFYSPDVKYLNFDPPYLKHI